jgi:AcrR family transcriptional regulator
VAAATSEETARAASPRDRILETAFRLFYAHGIRGVGVDAVIAESGVAKATLYKHFRRKDDLVLAYLEKVDQAWRAQLEAASEAAGPDPRDRLVGMFDALTTACRQDGFRGCAFINTASEAEPGSEVHARTVEHKAAVREWVRDLADTAGAPDPDGLSRALTLLLDGGLSAGVLDADPQSAEAAKGAARTLAETACPRDPPSGGSS